MADNVTLPGTGEVIATDDIAGLQFQRVKLIHGANNVNDGDASTANPYPVRTYQPAMTAVVMSLTTNATGTTYTAFGSQACTALDIVNTQPAAVDLEVRRGSSGSTIILPSGASRMFVGLTNANGIEVRRRDTSNTTVTITAEAIAA